jgi:D-alanyl-D-alanine dipeptidase
MSKFRLFKIAFFILIVLFYSCGGHQSKPVQPQKRESTGAVKPKSQPAKDSIGAIEREFIKAGLVDVNTIDSTILVNLKYSTTDNFVHRNMYGNLHRAYFRPEVAKAIAGVQSLLKQINPAYSLVIYDAARPVRIQREMFRLVKGTDNQRYVARPHGGGPHNYAIAVDIGLAFNGKEMDMGTPFDSFSPVSHINAEQYLVNSHQITPEALRNRQLLRRLMRKAGFSTFHCEWWHFEFYRTHYARSHGFKLL